MPFVHYLPYPGADEIVQFAHFLSCHEDGRIALTRGASEWRLDHYGPRQIWGALLARALG